MTVNRRDGVARIERRGCPGGAACRLRIAAARSRKCRWKNLPTAAKSPAKPHADARFTSVEIAARARSRPGEDRYRLITNNCEHFCEWCINGQPHSEQVERIAALPREAKLIARAVPACPWHASGRAVVVGRGSSKPPAALSRQTRLGGRRFLVRLDRGSAWRQLPGATREELLETLRITLAEALVQSRGSAWPRG